MAPEFSTKGEKSNSCVMIRHAHSSSMGAIKKIA